MSEGKINMEVNQNMLIRLIISNQTTCSIGKGKDKVVNMWFCRTIIIYTQTRIPRGKRSH